ncbi:MAG: HAD hydrolase family protein [Candidatus Omnitrophota bacterium]|nr:HAD hydrolase family protein [Candidatus Omnitrophota bacterium]
MKKSLLQKAKKIKLLIMDVDGVLTDGKIVFDNKGNELKFFDVQDGLGVVLLKRLGIKTAIITAKGSKVVERRALDMQVDRLYQDANHKIKAYEQLLKEFKFKDEAACFIADELIDLSVIKRVGFAVAVANAAPEIKKQAHYITKRKGGQGAVREVIELILKSQNLWQKALRLFE